MNGDWMLKMMILPINGRKYGFPKAIPEDIFNSNCDTTIKQWLIEEGYPEELIPEDGSLELHTYEEEWPDNPGECHAI